ncbi:MAG: type II secretion system ATPase GspE [Nitrospirae bacterium]|nr:type II secretion system ATPase GspE [Nitrospirota bacterium]
MSSPWKRIGQILQDKFAVSAEAIRDALALQREKGGRLGEILVRMRAVKEGEILDALGLQFRLPCLPDLLPVQVDPALLSKIPIGFAKRYELLPIREENGPVMTAVADPLHLTALDDVRALLGRDVRPVLVPAKAILNCINQMYDRASDTAQQVIEDLSAESLDLLASELSEPVDLLEATDEAPIIRLVNSALFQAVKDRASDIHIEPFERDLEIRYRIDGIMYKILSPPKRFQSSIISRIKIMAGLNIAEKRLPQDGRIGIKIAGRDVDIRVSVIPTAHGERVVLRLLDKSTSLLDLEEIGLTAEERHTMLQLIQMSHGIVLVTGPTGSGKTTTLYAALNRINSPDKNIITIEDPIEYQLKGIGQMQVNPKINLTFANGLRSILRQDPDVIMVGEIRDVETAEIAIHASLTGHLVFSTLHTNDTAGAITRLLDMGIEPFLVSSSVIAIIAQRLIRCLCLDCRQAYTPTPEELAKLGFKTATVRPTFYRAVGCDPCKRTGYHGRTGIYEILLIDDEVRQMILSKLDANRIKNRAVEKGMRTLRDDGARKVVSGVTTVEEILRVTQEELVME